MAGPRIPAGWRETGGAAEGSLARLAPRLARWHHHPVRSWAVIHTHGQSPQDTKTTGYRLKLSSKHIILVGTRHRVPLFRRGLRDHQHPVEPQLAVASPRPAMIPRRWPDA